MKKFILLLAFLSSVQAFAVGDAGCGLGSVIWRQNSVLLQLFAVTTNSTFGSQTFGITTGTSNCTAHGLVMNEKEQIMYVEMNYQKIIEDMAKGNGESLDTLAALLGCSKDSNETFGKFSREKFQTIVPANTAPVKLLDTLKSEVRQNSTLSKSCLSIS